MKKNDFIEQATELISEFGADYRLSEDKQGPKITWWFEENKPNTTAYPIQTQVSYRGLKNAGAELKRKLEAARPAHFVLQLKSLEERDEWQAQLNKVISEIRVEFKRDLDALRNEVAASGELSLETGAKVDTFVRAFQALGHTPPPAAETKPSRAPIQPQPEITVPAPIKRFDDLESVLSQKWAEVVKKIDAELELDDFEGRILYFLYECGPQTAHIIKKAGVWRGANSLTYFLEDMAAKRLVKYLVAERNWAITNEGIKDLKDDEEQEAPIVAKPVLTVVPPAPQPKILTEVPRFDPATLPVIDQILWFIYKNPNRQATTTDMRKAGLPGYGKDNDVSIVTSRASLLGFVHQEGRRV